ncbi:hypothetical protein IAT38_004808 [Cryptococcus sp. DSM 104549]
MSNNTTTPPPRRLLGKDEIDTVQGLGSFLKRLDAEHNFACTGTVPHSALDDGEIRLIYFKGEGNGDGKDKGSYEAATLPLSEEAANDNYAAGKTSPFGRGKDLVYDEGYRQAHEIKPPYFSLTADILSRCSILSLLALRLESTTLLEARLSKLNAYGEGGLFKPHRDTPKGDTRIGTLMLCLPSEFTGGELVVRHKDTDVTFDWATKSKTDISWGFLFSDCEHEVLP